MKLFEMRGEDAVDVLVDLSEPLSRLIANKATGDVLLKVCKLCSMGMPAVPPGSPSSENRTAPSRMM